MESLIKNRNENDRYDNRLKDYLFHALESAEKLTNSYNEILEENFKYKLKLKELNKEVERLKTLNSDLHIQLNDSKIKAQQPLVFIYYSEALESSLDHGLIYLDKFDWSKIERSRWNELLSTAVGYNCKDHIVLMLSRLIVQKSNNIEDAEISEIINQVSNLIDNAKTLDISNEEITRLLNILYEFTNEDNLCEFTYNYKDYLTDLSLSATGRYISFRIKLARILYSLEELDLADSLLYFIDDINSENIINISNDAIIDLFLILIHLTGYESLEDFPFVNKRVLDDYEIVSKAVLAYFDALNDPNIMIDTIKYIRVVNSHFDDKLTGVEELIRNLSFKFMIDRLTKRSNYEKEPVLHKQIEEADLPMPKSYDSDLYHIKNILTDCPFCEQQLKKEVVLRKVYNSRQDKRNDLNGQYKQVEVSHCKECEYCLRIRPTMSTLRPLVVP